MVKTGMYQPARPKVSKIAKTELEISIYREKWEEILKKYPNAGRSELNRIAPSIYCWLYKYDREWLKSNFPPVINTYKFVDWEAWDLKMRISAEEAYNTLMSHPGKPIRITKTSLSNEILRGPKRKFGKLPEYSKYVNSVVETRLEYTKRCIRWLTQVYCEEGILPSRNKFLDRLVVGRDLKNEIYPYIDQALDTISAHINAY